MAPRQLVTVQCLLFTALFSAACTASPTPFPQASLFIYRFDPPAFVEYSADLQPVDEIPFHLPPDCGLYNTFPAPLGPVLLIELSCPGGQTVLFLDTSTSLSASSESASVTQPVTEADAHFLAWTSDGEAAYLKIDSLGNPRVIRAETDGDIEALTIDEFTYDLAAAPDSRDFTFTFSRGLGYGSEFHFSRNDGRSSQALYTDPFNYISFARFSPDGAQIAFIKTPDVQTPFTVGELWVMEADGAYARKLADADAGHGFAANWSPDGTRIAFVVRENPEEEAADRASEALVSNIYVIEVDSGQLTQVTHFEDGHVETPFWSPEGNTLTFNVVLDGRMAVSAVGWLSGEIQFLETESACCPAWMRK